MASDFQTEFGYDSYNPAKNFRISSNISGLGLDPASAEFRNLVANQNGIVFFPGSTPLYGGTTVIGGFGISGDGVDQDDVVTFYGAQGFLPPEAISSADDVRVRNTRLPYQKFNRHPFG
ncbi:MAG: heme-binding protein, partial [Planctomycetaceae bacterium]|nr:heme-binding protein [Planctomycetaceae bacterium]